MRSTKILVVAGLSFITALFASWGQALEAGAQYWQVEPSGEAEVGKDGVAGTRFNVKEDFGYKRKDMLGFAGAFGGGSQLIFGYDSFDLAGNGSLSKPLDFGGINFAAGTEARSTMQADLLRVGYRYQSGTRGFRGGVLVGVQRVQYEASVSANEYGYASGDADAYLPIVGVQLRFDPASIIRIDLSLIKNPVDVESTKIDFLDFEANLRVNLAPFFVGIGYRKMTIDAREKDTPVKADLKFSGPQLIAGLTF